MLTSLNRQIRRNNESGHCVVPCPSETGNPDGAWVSQKLGDPLRGSRSGPLRSQSWCGHGRLKAKSLKREGRARHPVLQVQCLRISGEKIFHYGENITAKRRDREPRESIRRRQSWRSPSSSPEIESSVRPITLVTSAVEKFYHGNNQTQMGGVSHEIISPFGPRCM